MKGLDHDQASQFIQPFSTLNEKTNSNSGEEFTAVSVEDALADLEATINEFNLKVDTRELKHLGT